jgi:hypothetical protein
MELITTLEACQLLIGAQHYKLFRRMFRKLEGAPQPVKRRGYGSCNRYDKAEIIAFGKDRDVLKEIKKAWSIYIMEWQENDRAKKAVDQELFRGYLSLRAA